MMKLISKEQFAKTLAKAEETLNLIGYVPMISILSSAVRMMGGKLQALLGLGIALFSLITMFKSRNPIRRFMNLRSSMEQCIHGVANIIRALIEAVPFLSLVICLPYDRLFKKRLKYSLEECDIIEIKVDAL